MIAPLIKLFITRILMIRNAAIAIKNTSPAPELSIDISSTEPASKSRRNVTAPTPRNIPMKTPTRVIANRMNAPMIKSISRIRS